MRALRPLLAGALAALLAPGVAAADDAALLRVVDTRAGGVRAALERAAGNDPSLVQASYDAARDMQVELTRSAPVSSSCRALLSAAQGLASGAVRSAEGVDRLDGSQTATARARARAAAARLPGARAACRPGRAPRRPALQPISPADGEAFFGAIVALGPAAAREADVVASGRTLGTLAVTRGRLRARLNLPAGRYDLRVVFRAGDRVVGQARTDGVQLLPRSGRRAVPSRGEDRALSATLRRAAGTFRGISALWLQDLRTGRTGQWNATARFPAASMVKIGVMAAAMPRLGPAPEASSERHDLASMLIWSSNLAANRLLGRIGGSGTATAGLARLGATSSTYTGRYIVGTELQPSAPAGATATQPPLISQRVTTARDMARALFAIHAAAIGQPAARRETRLTPHAARLALGWLLASEPFTDNIGILRESIRAGVPIAQKHGWFSRVRHTAAIVYTPSGPWIAVALTYGDGLTRGEASGLGRRLAALIPTG